MTKRTVYEDKVVKYDLLKKSFKASKFGGGHNCCHDINKNDAKPSDTQGIYVLMTRHSRTALISTVSLYISLCSAGCHFAEC